MKLLRSFSIYTIASFVNKGMMFAIIPFLTNVISPQQNGILSLFSIFVMFVSPFTLLGFSNSIVIEYSKLNKNEYRSFFSSSLLLSTISFLLLLFLFLIFGQAISDIVGAPYKLLFWGLLYAYGNIYFEGMLAYLRAVDEPITYFLVSIGKSAFELGLIIWLVIQAGRGAEGKVLASLAGSAAIFICALFYFVRQRLLTTRIKKKYILLEAKFGFSQIFFLLNLCVLSVTDKYMIQHVLHDTAGLGIYFVANQLAFIVNVMVNAFFLSYQPQLYAYLSDLNMENKYRLVRIKYLFAAFLFICTIILVFATPLFYHLFISNKEYHAGIKYVAWNAFAFFFWGLYSLFLGYLYYYRKNTVVIIFSVFSSALCISLNYFLIKEFNIMGAAYADLLTYFLLFVAIVITVKRVLNLNLPWWDLKKIFNSKYHVQAAVPNIKL